MAIEIKGLAFSYVDAPVLHGIDATFDEGRVHLILGRTGSGKTTLALILAGLLEPRSGSVTIDGARPRSKDLDRRLVQLAFQFPEAQIFEASVEKEISYGLKNFGYDQEQAMRRCRWALECVGLEHDLLPRDPDSLSFGERRKVALASVMAIRPKYLILDEPLAGLDWRGRASLVKAIEGLGKVGTTTLVLTHEADIIAEIGDTVTLICDGAFSGPMQVDVFLYSGDHTDRGMLPEYILTLLKLKAQGLAGQQRPRWIEDVSAHVLSALGLARRC